MRSLYHTPLGYSPLGSLGPACMVTHRSRGPSCGQLAVEGLSGSGELVARAPGPPAPEPGPVLVDLVAGGRRGGLEGLRRQSCLLQGVERRLLPRPGHHLVVRAVEPPGGVLG